MKQTKAILHQTFTNCTTTTRIIITIIIIRIISTLVKCSHSDAIFLLLEVTAHHIHWSDTEEEQGVMGRGGDDEEEHGMMGRGGAGHDGIRCYVTSMGSVVSDSPFSSFSGS